MDSITAVVIVFATLIGIGVIMGLSQYLQIRKQNELKEHPLSANNKEFLSCKIEAINSYETELLDYVECVLYSSNILRPELLIADLKTDERIAKDFRWDCQKIMESGIKLNPSHVFSLEDEFFDEYKKLKVLKLAECEDTQNVCAVLYDISEAASRMNEYLKSFTEKGYLEQGETNLNTPLEPA